MLCILRWILAHQSSSVNMVRNNAPFSRGIGLVIDNGIQSRMFELLYTVVRIELTALSINDDWICALLVRTAKTSERCIQRELCLFMIEEC
jgi:hypothetical protein